MRSAAAPMAGPSSAVLASIQQALASVPAAAANVVSTRRASSSGGGAGQPEFFTLRDTGLQLPAIGLGCGYNPTDDAERGQISIETALDCGYKHLDTAQRCGTEAAVGAALAERFAADPLTRRDIWVTTKVANPRPAFPGSGMAVGGGIGYMLKRVMDPYTGLLEEFAGCIASLHLDHVDLLLMHYPGQPPVRMTRKIIVVQLRRRRRELSGTAVITQAFVGSIFRDGVSCF